MAMGKAPGKHYRTGLGLKGLSRKFPDDNAAEKWFQDWIRKGEPHCPKCGSANVNTYVGHPAMPHRCREKGRRSCFPVKTGTVMEASIFTCQDWAIAIYLYHTNLKGISSMCLHRDLEVTRSTAWFLLHRLRKAEESELPLFAGVVEADETFIGAKANRRHKRRHASRVYRTGGGSGATGKVPVARIREKAAGRTRMAVLPDTGGETVKGVVLERTVPGAEVCTNRFKGCVGLDKMHRKHETNDYKAGRYVR